MSPRLRTGLALTLILCVAAAVFFRGLAWGLPGRDADRWLFGTQTPWTGAEILSRLPPAATSPTAVRGADVDADAILDRSRPVTLNDTDAKRAAIVQRYRLMSGQPDEFIQFKALAEMATRTGLAKLDPRLYQYGGLWIYPVGGLVRIAMATGLIETPPAGTSAREFYLDRPDAFGRFYVVARAYSAVWGVVGALAIFWLGRRATMCRGLGVLAALAFIALPVVRTAAHEAKPHLAGAALCLLAVIAATKYVETGRRRWFVGAGALCGAAMAMVVSMLLALAVLPAMVWVRCKRSSDASIGRPLILAMVVAFAVYATTNPFVLLNAVLHPDLLRSNLGNSTAMYGVRGIAHMLPDTIRIAGHAMTPVGFRVALAASVAMLVCCCRRSRVASLPTSPHAHITSVALLTVPALLVALQFVLLAAGKPAEYARFGIVPAAAGCVAIVAAIAGVMRAGRAFGVTLLLAMAACLLIPPIGVRTSYDAWKWEADDETARALDALRHVSRMTGSNDFRVYRVGVMYEPAPWSAPPLNLFEQEIVLVPPRMEAFESIDVLVWPLNLESQLVGSSVDHESLDWRQNRFRTRAEDRDGDGDRWRGGW